MTTTTELTSSECAQLLHAGVFGRVVLADGPRGAEILPVNYVTVADAVLIRTSVGSLLDRHADQAPLLFEIDHVNYERGHGWSVVARGTGERLDDDERSLGERQAVSPPRWLPGSEWSWIRLRWTELSGRRTGPGWDVMSELPVRRVGG